MAIEKKIVVSVETEGEKTINELNDSITLLNEKQNALKENVKVLQKAYKDAAGDINLQAEANKNLASAQTELNSNSMKLRDAKKELNLETKNQSLAESGLMDQLSAMPGIIGSAATSVKGFGMSLKALAANPVGAVLMVIVGAVTLLYNIFKDFQPLVDAIEQGFAALNAVGSMLKQTFIDMVVGTDDATKSMDGLGTSIKKTTEAAIELKKQQQDLEDIQLANTVANAEAKAKIDELLVQSKNRNKTEEERIALINKAIETEKKNYDNKVKQNDLEQDLAFRQMILGKNITAEDLKNLQKGDVAYAKSLQDRKGLRDADIENWRKTLIDKWSLIGEHTMMEEKAQARADKLADDDLAKKEKAEAKRIADAEKAEAKRKSNNDKAIAKRDKDRDNQIKSDKTALETFILLQGKADEQKLANDEEYFNDRLDLLDIEKEKEKAIIDEEVKFGKKTLAEANLEKLKLDNKYSDQKKELSVKRINTLMEDLKFEVELEKLKNEETLAGKKLTNDELHKLELERIQKDKDAKLNELNLRLISEPEKEKEIKDQIAIVKQTAQTETAVSNANFDKSQAELHEQNLYDQYSNQLTTLSEFNLERYDIMKNQMELDKQKELSVKDLTVQQKLDIENKYTKLSKDLAENELNYKLDAAKDLISGLSELFNQGSKAAKIAATTVATINGYEEISGIFKSTAGWGPTGWALGSVKALSAGIRTVSTIKKIWAANGTSAPSVTPDTSVVVPPQIVATSNTLTNTQQQLQQTSQKVYVLESDITTTQNKVNTAKVESTF